MSSESKTASDSDPAVESTETNPVLEKARGDCEHAIKYGFEQSHPVLIDALPAMGKSRGVIEWAANTGNPLSVFTARTKLYEQLQSFCNDEGLNPLILPTLHKDCETANGTHGTEWATRVTNVYREKELLPSELHEEAEKLFDEPLPCRQEGECSYFTAREFNPDDYDVLIGHYRHAHVPNRVEDRYVAFDEFPDDEFLTEYSATQVSTAVSTYLATHEDLPFQYVRDLKEYRRDPAKKQAGVEWFEQNNPTLQRDVSMVVDNKRGDAHPEAAVITYAILVATDLDNRWEYASLPEGRTAVSNPSDGTLTVLNPPRLHDAVSVIALDGTPTVPKWKLMLGDELEHHPILTEPEQREYLRDALGIEVIQYTRAVNHYSGHSTISVTPEKDLALFEAVARREYTQPALITSKSALAKYEEHGLDDEVGTTKYYGDVKGMNTFTTTRVGIVSGSPHYGDDYIKKWAALAGESVTRVPETKGMEQDFGAFGNQILHGMREHEVLQAVMRFGRDSIGATVYVHTAALSEWVERTAIISDIRKWPDGMDEVLAAINESGKTEWRTKEIEETVSLSSQQIRDHLHTLREYGFVSVRQEGRGYTWSDKNLGEIGERGHIVLAKPPIED